MLTRVSFAGSAQPKAIAITLPLCWIHRQRGKPRILEIARVHPSASLNQLIIAERFPLNIDPS
jgi:hypothetical protein